MSTAPDLVRVAFDLGRTRWSGRLAIGGDVFPVTHGSVALDADDPLGRRAEHRLSAHADGAPRLTAGAPAAAPRPGLPLDAWARRHVARALAAQGDDGAMRRLADLTGFSLDRGRLPRAADLDPADAAILAALPGARTLAELARAARAPRFRVVALLALLARVGVLAPKVREAPARPTPPPVDPARAAALHVLGLPAGAEPSAVKATFRRLSRALHPDRNGHADPRAQRALAQSFADVAAAYRLLCQGG